MAYPAGVFMRSFSRERETEEEVYDKNATYGTSKSSKRGGLLGRMRSLSDVIRKEDATEAWEIRQLDNPPSLSRDPNYNVRAEASQKVRMRFWVLLRELAYQLFFPFSIPAVLLLEGRLGAALRYFLYVRKHKGTNGIGPSPKAVMAMTWVSSVFPYTICLLVLYVEFFRDRLMTRYLWPDVALTMGMHLYWKACIAAKYAVRVPASERRLRCHAERRNEEMLSGWIPLLHNPELVKFEIRVAAARVGLDLGGAASVLEMEAPGLTIASMRSILGEEAARWSLSPQREAITDSGIPGHIKVATESVLLSIILGQLKAGAGQEGEGGEGENDDGCAGSGGNSEMQAWVLGKGETSTPATKLVVAFVMAMLPFVTRHVVLAEPWSIYTPAMATLTAMCSLYLFFGFLAYVVPTVLASIQNFRRRYQWLYALGQLLECPLPVPDLASQHNSHGFEASGRMVRRLSRNSAAAGIAGSGSNSLAAPGRAAQGKTAVSLRSSFDGVYTGVAADASTSATLSSAVVSSPAAVTGGHAAGAAAAAMSTERHADGEEGMHGDDEGHLRGGIRSSSSVGGSHYGGGGGHYTSGSDHGLLSPMSEESSLVVSSPDVSATATALSPDGPSSSTTAALAATTAAVSDRVTGGHSGGGGPKITKSFSAGSTTPRPGLAAANNRSDVGGVEVLPLGAGGTEREDHNNNSIGTNNNEHHHSSDVAGGRPTAGGPSSPWSSPALASSILASTGTASQAGAAGVYSRSASASLTSSRSFQSSPGLDNNVDKDGGNPSLPPSKSVVLSLTAVNLVQWERCRALLLHQFGMSYCLRIQFTVAMLAAMLAFQFAYLLYRTLVYHTEGAVILLRSFPTVMLSAGLGFIGPYLHSVVYWGALGNEESERHQALLRRRVLHWLRQVQTKTARSRWIRSGSSFKSASLSALLATSRASPEAATPRDFSPSSSTNAATGAALAAAAAVATATTTSATADSVPPRLLKKLVRLGGGQGGAPETGIGPLMAAKAELQQAAPAREGHAECLSAHEFRLHNTIDKVIGELRSLDITEPIALFGRRLDSGLGWELSITLSSFLYMLIDNSGIVAALTAPKPNVALPSVVEDSIALG